jgi:hypothetical protein
MTMRMLSNGLGLTTICTAMVLCAALVAAPTVNADYVSGFEDLNAAPEGVVLTGQDGYYIPPGTDSADFLAYVYSDNALGLPQNPTGGDQFIGGTGPASPTFARAQRDMSFADSATWMLAYDFAAVYLGSGASANNIGSFSLRNEVAGGVTHYIHLMSWVDPEDPTSYNAFYMGYDVGGTQFAQPGMSPGFMWEGLQLDHWYRAWLLLDLEANMIIEVGISDLQDGGQEIFLPTDWYLEGGGGGASAPPMNFRFFAGGTVAGNSVAFDNIAIESGPVATESKTWSDVKALYR